VVVATSDEPALMRLQAAQTARAELGAVVGFGRTGRSVSWTGGFGLR